MGVYSEIYIKCRQDKVPQVQQWLEECEVLNAFSLENADSDYPTFVQPFIKWYGNYSDLPGRTIKDFMDWVEEQEHIVLLEVSENNECELYGDDSIDLEYFIQVNY